MHWAEDLIGRPWVAGGRGPHAFDCWGLARWCWRERFRIEVPEIPVDAANLRGVLHAARDIGVVFQGPADLTAHGWRIEGTYRFTGDA